MRFDRDWFDKNQVRLLSFVNTRLGRWFFGITEKDVSRKVRITELKPNLVSHGERHFRKDGKWFVEKTTEFKGLTPYQSKLEQIYEKACKMFPTAFVAACMEPHAALGFLPLMALTTATFYPNASPTTTSVDGWISNGAGGSFSSIQSAVTGTSVYPSPPSSVAFIFQSSGTTNFWISLLRSIFLFDTSSLGSSSTVSAATLSLYEITRMITFP